MTRHAFQASTSTPNFPAALPPPMHLPPNLRIGELQQQLDELLKLEGCIVSLLRATRQSRELGASGTPTEALEAEAMHRMRALDALARQYGSAPVGDAPVPPSLASAGTSLSTAAFVVAALTLAGYRRLEDLATRASDIESLRFAVTAIAEVGGAARQIAREIGKAAGATE